MVTSFSMPLSRHTGKQTQSGFLYCNSVSFYLLFMHRWCTQQLALYLYSCVLVLTGAAASVEYGSSCPRCVTEGNSKCWRGLSFMQILTVALGFIFLQVALVRQIFLILRAFTATKCLSCYCKCCFYYYCLQHFLCLQIQSFINLIKISLIRKSIFTPYMEAN